VSRSPPVLLLKALEYLGRVLGSVFRPSQDAIENGCYALPYPGRHYTTTLLSQSNTPPPSHRSKYSDIAPLAPQSPYTSIQEAPNQAENMRKSPLNPSVTDQAPAASTLTGYDERHLFIYVDLLEAEADGADWDEAALLVLRIDPILEPTRARRAWESHLARAKWMIQHGYQHLLRTQAETTGIVATQTS